MAVKWQANQFTMVELEAGVENKPGVEMGIKESFEQPLFPLFVVILTIFLAIRVTIDIEIKFSIVNLPRYQLEIFQKCRLKSKKR